MIALTNIVVGSNGATNRILVKGVTRGFVSNSNNKLQDVTIKVYKFNKLVTTFYSNSKAKFEFEIPKNSYITLVFEKENFISKKILFDTRTDLNVDHVNNKFDLNIMLIERIEGVDYSDLDFPATKIFFSEKEDDYTYAIKNTKSMLKKQEEILVQMEEKTVVMK